MKKLSALLASLLLALGLGLLVPATASAAGYCGITWGSLPKSAPFMSRAHITDVRGGEHPCFDRLVVDLNGPAPGYNVRYVDRVTSPGSGLPVPLRGGAFLQIAVRAPAYDDKGNPTYTPANRNEIVNVCGYRTFRQVAYVSSFEGVTDFGLGVRARLPFRVFTLSGPGTGSRLVVDVAHRW